MLLYPPSFAFRVFYSNERPVSPVYCFLLRTSHARGCNRSDVIIICRLSRQDERFNHDVDVMTGYHTRSMLCLPIKDSNNEVIGVAQVINKQGDPDATFTAHDSRVFASYLQFCGIGLKNAQLYERSQLEIKRNQVSRPPFPRSFVPHVTAPSPLRLTDRCCSTWPA